jgi:hypothetical protein
MPLVPGVHIFASDAGAFEVTNLRDDTVLDFGRSTEYALVSL